jgi:hypothetical protein
MDNWQETPSFEPQQEPAPRSRKRTTKVEVAAAEPEIGLQPPNSTNNGQAPKQTAAVMKVDPKTQQIVLNDNAEMLRLITVFMEGKALPKTLDTPAKVISAWQMAASLRIPPAIAIQNMAFINGTISIWGQLPKGLAEATGELSDCRVFWVDKEFNEICVKGKNLDAQVWAAVVRIKRKARSVNEYFYSVEDAKTAGLLGKDVWKSYLRIMLARRAMGHAIKFEFPDALMGLSIAEYDHNIAPDLVDVTESSEQVADKLNATVIKRDMNTGANDV